MAFVKHEDLAPDPRKDTQFRVIKEASNMSGVFQVGTILTCTRVRKQAMDLEDDRGNGLLLNFSSVAEHLEPVVVAEP